MRSLRDRWARARSDEDFAWACLLTNLVGIPGLGTLMAHRREGIPQLVLSIVGGVATTWWLVLFVAAELRQPSLPPPPDAPDLGLALWGIGIFIVAWLWSLASSLTLLRAARRRGPGGPEPTSP